MPITTAFDIIELKDELVNRLRAGLNVDDTLSRITETTTTFDGDDSTTKFTLSATALSYVASVSVEGVVQEYITDYSIHFRGSDKGKIEFVTAPTTGTDNISVTWGEINTGKSNFIWPDFPRIDLGLHSYPRIGFRLSDRNEVAGLGGSDLPLKHDIMVQIKIVDDDTYSIDNLLNKVRLFLLQNAKSFYYFNFIAPESWSEYEVYDDNISRGRAKMLQFVIPNKYEIITYAT
jgi:hypothetical protein